MLLTRPAALAVGLIVLISQGMGCGKTALQTSGPRGDQYSVVEGWPRLPAGYVLGQVAGVAVDSRGHVWIFHRAGASYDNDQPIPQPTVAELDAESGELLSTWGEGLFVAPHGLSIDPEDNLWLTDVGTDLVHKFDQKGKELMRLGRGEVR